MATTPQQSGQHPPGSQPATPGKREQELNQQAEPIEKKHRADDTSGQPEPSANPKRAPEHTPGYEAEQKAKEAKDKPKEGDKNDREDAGHAGHARARPAAAKQHVKRKTPAKKPVRKHR